MQCADCIVAGIAHIWSMLLLTASDDAADDKGEDGVDNPQNEGCNDCSGGDIGAEAFEDCHRPCATDGYLGGGHIRRDGDKQVIQRQTNRHRQRIELTTAEEQREQQLETEHRVAHE